MIVFITTKGTGILLRKVTVPESYRTGGKEVPRRGGRVESMVRTNVRSETRS